MGYYWDRRSVSRAIALSNGKRLAVQTVASLSISKL